MFDVGKLSRLTLGHLDENDTNVIEIDVSEWLRDCPEGVCSIWCVRHGEEASPYPVLTETVDGVIRWTVTDYDTQKPGKGLCIVMMYGPDRKRRRTRDIVTIVDESAVGISGEDVPEGSNPWAERVLRQVPDMQRLITEAQSALEQLGAYRQRVVSDNDGWVLLGGGVDGMKQYVPDTTVEEIGRAADAWAVRQELNELEARMEARMLDQPGHYPVGRTVITFGEENPGDYLGGVWEKVEGRVLMGADANNEAGTTGGSSSVMLMPEQMPQDEAR